LDVAADDAGDIGVLFFLFLDEGVVVFGAAVADILSLNCPIS